MADNEELQDERPRGYICRDNSDNSRDDVVSQSFDLMRNYFDQQFNSLKRDLRDEVHTSSIETFKRFRGDCSSYTFKYKGNQRQHTFNSDLIQDLELTSDLLKKGERRQSVLDSLCDIRKKLSRRNKLIKIADKSPAGWDTVNEYLSDELASDSEDDKKLRRAEKRALEKKKPRPTKKPNSSASFTSGLFSSCMDSQLGAAVLPGNSTTPSSFRQFRRNPSFIQCFACGVIGHTRPDCPSKMQAPSTNPTTRGFSGLSWQKGGDFPSQVVKHQGRESTEDK